MWVSAGLRMPVASVAVTPDGSVLVLAVDQSVHRRTPEGEWRETLRAKFGSLETPEEIDEEDILMDAEGLMEEIQSLMDAASRDPEADDEGDDEAVDDDTEAGERAEDPSDDDSMAEMADMWVGDERGDGADLGPRPDALIWASSELNGVALVARDDGLWRSNDHGATWTKAGIVGGVYAFVDGHAEYILAGTEAGLRVSTDLGDQWEPINDPVAAVTVFSFGRDGDRIYAGTAEGLFRSQDGLRWAKTLSRYDTDVPVWRIAVDPHWDDGLWVTGPVGILRSDDGGEQLRAPSRNMLPGTVSILALKDPGHLLAAGIDGVWESVDGGTRWRAISSGLPSPANRVLAPGPLVGGADGMFGLRQTDPEAVAARTRVQEVPPGADVGALVSTALNRPGMDLDNILSQGSIAKALLLPSLQITAKRTRSRYITGDYEARSNKGSASGSWTVGVTACFGACAGSAAGSISDLAAVSDGGGAYESVTVVGDEVYSLNETGSMAPMAANVSERVTRYRTDVAGVVGELALVRHRLMEARGSVAVLSLREQVKHELDVLEATARLDVYTNGYLSRVLDGS